MDKQIELAIARWPLEQCHVQLAAHRENVVYRVDSAQGSYALRMHRSGYRTEAELNSEMLWLFELARNGMSVPEPVSSMNGCYLERVEGQFCSLLRWMRGVPLGQSGTPLQIDQPGHVFFTIGQQMARLHTLSDSWRLPTAFTRHAWDLAGLLGTQPTWGRFWENPGLSRDDLAIIQRVRNSAHDILNSVSHFDIGLIHADLLRENILINGTGVSFIDFDDGGFGYRLFDLATTLHRVRDEPNYRTLEDALLSGYRDVRLLDTSHLKLFIALRAFTYLGWIMPRMHEPGKAVRNTKLVAEALAAAEVFLSAR
jgi:Ser/Thr protein kinase RdoA (MazF antagonist)